MEKSSNRFIQLWNKVPQIIRAIVLGLLISTAGVMLWSVVAVVIPIPWSFVLMIGILAVYLLFFSGQKWFASSKSFRQFNFRKTRFPGKIWILALLAALLIVLIEQSGLVVTFRIVEFPAERFTSEYEFLNSVPRWAAWLVVIMISAVAGICEETGFRGYMQKPMEEKQGPYLAIGIASVLFVIVHLHQAWSGPLLVQIFLISVLFGTLAYASGSLIPGIIGHFLMDICNFSFWWSTLGKQFNAEPLKETGIDTPFLLWSLLLIVSILLFIWIIRRLTIH